MLFNSIPFLIFFGAVYFIYWNIPKKTRLPFLLFSGFLFYGYSSVSFLIHFLVVIIINYFLYKKIAETKNRKLLILAVTLNILNLGFFKYFYFLCSMLGDMIWADSLFPLKDALKNARNFINVPLPLAISFYSFQIIACTVDAYRSESKEPITFYKYILFIFFFPVLIAGPIMRTNDFFPNLERETPQKDDIVSACFLLMSGLVKKVLIADPVASIISPVYANPGEYHASSIFMAGILYTIQVFSDFSGLTDMARAVALFLGFKLPENFLAPFFSTSGRELWRRWHVTLSLWLRDYIYFPLGGNRKGELRTYANLIITMTIGGIWHGADYTFIVWGAYWGILLALERFGEEKLGLPLTPEKSRVLKVFKAFIIFVLFSISALMFRANNPNLMMDEFSGIFVNDSNLLQRELVSRGEGWIIEGMKLVEGNEPLQMNRIKNTEYETAFYLYIAFLLFHYIQYYPEKLDGFKKHSVALAIVLGIITIFLLVTLSRDGDAFIYYKF